MLYFLRAVVGSQQNWKEGRDFFVCSLPPHMHSLPHFHHPQPKGMFVTTDEPVLTHHNQPKSIVYN